MCGVAPLEHLFWWDGGSKNSQRGKNVLFVSPLEKIPWHAPLLFTLQNGEKLKI